MKMSTKKLITTIIITAAFALPGAGAPPRVIPGEPAVEAAVQDAAPKPDEAAAEQLDRAQAQIAEAQRRIEQATAKAEAQVAKAEAEAEVAEAAAAAQEAAVPRTPDLPGLTRTLNGMMRRSPGQSGKTLLIRSSEPSSKEQSNLEEDLAVMTRILDKAVDDQAAGQPRPRKAMGIDVYFASSGTPVRSLYLDGYGAVFMLKVGFPLLPPPTKEAQKEKSETSSTWEEAREEIYGHPNDSKAMVAGTAEEYDEDKVNSLKDSLFEALKNAKNIRDLKPDDSVTVCVFGGPGAGRTQTRTTSRRTPAPIAETGNHVWVFSDNHSSPGRGTVLTIRVKKSDVDAFAKGSQDVDAFRKKAKVTAYTGSIEGSGAPMAFGSGFSSSFEYPR